jgi:nicotinamidase-related amidase
VDPNTPKLDPRRSALLVMDYQEGIAGRLPGAGPLVERVEGAITFAREHGMQVGYVRVAFTEADYDAVPSSNKGFSQMAGAGRNMTDGTPATAILAAIAPRPGDIQVRKVRVGAFSTTDLAAQLADRGVDTLVLAGVSTSGVVLSTVRDAADHDYRLYVLEDACADRDPEVHALLMTKVFPRQAWVIETADIEALVQAT